MDEIVRFENQFYISTSSSLVDDRSRVLKQGDTFAIFDRYGDIHPVGLGRHGIYHEGTRFLSGWSLRLNGSRPLFLSSTVKNDNLLLTIDLSNPDFQNVPRGVLHMFRAKFIWKDVCYERIRLSNFGLAPIDVAISIQAEADFADIFEIRGLPRKRRGRDLPAVLHDSELLLGYEGLDDVVRHTRIVCDPRPDTLTHSEISYKRHLDPKAETVLNLCIASERAREQTSILSFDDAYAQADRDLKQLTEPCEIATSNNQFNVWLQRSLADLCTMVTQTPYGPYPYAGIPWFSTVFGRDGIITALQMLWLKPEIARGVLNYLAATQATEIIVGQEAEPGKILHEARGGEMAALGEIPFRHYYGSVDSTPLFVILAGAYYERTADRSFIETLWPHLEAALNWMDQYGDADGDGFVEYVQRSPQGLTHQGWKDSHDSVFHSDGHLAEGSIALCEVQGYVYRAKLAAADLAEMLGHADRARALRQQARSLQERFEQTFWCDDLSIYALALDGKKRPCRVRSSNAGQCLFTEIARADRAIRMAHTLFDDNSYSGWGIRTLAATEARYNPMSYHNGSVWPHDNALIAWGLSKYGLKPLAIRVLTGFFDASSSVARHRLPELLCGFRRRPDEAPTLYPVACSPQAWASGAVFMLVQAFLGLSIDATKGHVSFDKPHLPSFIHTVAIRHLQAGTSTYDIQIKGHAEDLEISTRPIAGPAVNRPI